MFAREGAHMRRIYDRAKAMASQSDGSSKNFASEGLTDGTARNSPLE